MGRVRGQEPHTLLRPPLCQENFNVRPEEAAIIPTGMNFLDTHQLNVNVAK